MIYDAHLDYWERQITTIREYNQIVEGKRRDREFNSVMARKIAYFAFMPHSKRKIKETDLWRIGDDDEVDHQRAREWQKTLKEYGRKNNIKII